MIIDLNVFVAIPILTLFYNFIILLFVISRYNLKYN